MCCRPGRYVILFVFKRIAVREVKPVESRSLLVFAAVSFLWRYDFLCSKIYPLLFQGAIGLV